MFNSVALDVVIGLVFIYLLYSLLANIIQELISTNLGLRAKILKHGISRMLDDGTESKELSKTFYEHPLIKYLGENKLFSKPSYLSAKNFSKVVIDLLRGKDVKPGEDFATKIQQSFDENKTLWGAVGINKETLSYLKSLWADAEGNVDIFKALLEHWFDDNMQRVSGWYKKRIQLILFCIGMSMAVLFNLDSISIDKKLSRDPKLSKALAENASLYMQTHKELGNQMATNDRSHLADSLQKNLSETQLDSISKYVVVQSNMLIDSANSMVQNEIKTSNEMLGLGWECQCKKHGNKICISENFNYWLFLWVRLFGSIC